MYFYFHFYAADDSGDSVNVNAWIGGVFALGSIVILGVIVFFKLRKNGMHESGTNNSHRNNPLTRFGLGNEG